MPFRSKQQEKWAFATHQDFAKKWADMSDQGSLPKKVKKKRRKKGKRKTKK